MEEKIYERQVTKQSLAQRVVDEHQIASHFTRADLQELYNFQPDRLDDPNRPERPTPTLPKVRHDTMHFKHAVKLEAVILSNRFVLCLVENICHEHCLADFVDSNWNKGGIAITKSEIHNIFWSLVLSKLTVCMILLHCQWKTSFVSRFNDNFNLLDLLACASLCKLIKL